MPEVPAEDDQTSIEEYHTDYEAEYGEVSIVFHQKKQSANFTPEWPTADDTSIEIDSEYLSDN